MLSENHHKNASFKISKDRQPVREKDVFPSGKNRLYVIAAALLALFLGALDTLIMGAAMPTIVSDLGGIQLFNSKKLYMISIAIF